MFLAKTSVPNDKHNPHKSYANFVSISRVNVECTRHLVLGLLGGTIVFPLQHLPLLLKALSSEPSALGKPFGN